MALIFLKVLIVFTFSSFEFQQVRLPWLHLSLMLSGPNSPNLNRLSGLGAMLESDKSCNRSQNQLPSLKCT